MLQHTKVDCFLVSGLEVITGNGSPVPGRIKHNLIQLLLISLRMYTTILPTSQTSLGYSASLITFQSFGFQRRGENKKS
jgi:hypothetical protein